MITELNTIVFPPESDIAEQHNLNIQKQAEREIERENNKRRSIVFPVHGLDNIGSNRDISTYLTVRRTLHENGKVSYAFGTIWYSAGVRLTKKQVEERGKIALTSFNGLRIMPFRDAQGNKAVKRVNVDGDIVNDLDVARTLKAVEWAITAELLYQKAQSSGMAYPDFSQSSINLDHNAPIHFGGIVKLKTAKYGLLDESTLTDAQFDALFAAN